MAAEEPQARAANATPASKDAPRAANTKTELPGLHPPRGEPPRPAPGTLPYTHFPTKPDTPRPQSQSLSRSYGSDLPTSLTYIILSTRGSSPWRPAADMGTNRRDTPRDPHPDFQGPTGLPGHRSNAVLFATPYHISLLRIPGSPNAHAEKKTLPGAPDGISGFVHVTRNTRIVRRFRNRVPE